MLDTSIRPQDDFWRYANGKWLATTEIPADRPAWDSFNALRDTTQGQLRDLIEGIGAQDGNAEHRKLATLYASFMNEKEVEADGLTGLKEEIARIRAIADKQALPALFAHLSLIWVRVPMVIDVEGDKHDSTTWVGQIQQGWLGLPDRDYYLKDDPHFQSIRATYRGHIARMLALAGEQAGEAGVEDIVALETALARLQWSRVQNRDPVKTYNKRAVAELPALVGEGGWRSYLAAMSYPEILKSIIVLQPSYLEGLNDVLRDVPLATWKTWLTFNLLSAYAAYLPEPFVAEDFAFMQKTLRGVPEQPPRWKRGVATVDRALGFALGHLYVDRTFPPASKTHAEAMVKHFLETFRQGVETLDWMDAPTRAEALKKLTSINPKIGYPDKWRDYSRLGIRQGDLVGNVMRARRFDYEFWLGKIGTKVERDEWWTTPQIVNAFYNPNKNEITFPAGVLQPPFFDASADDAANYGAIGTVIGHEISHAFDDEGSRYDDIGELRNWWTAAARTAFDRKTHEVVAQYNAFSPLPGYTVNGQLTLGENVADNSGLGVAVKAYRRSLTGKPAPTLDGFTGEQRLFLAFAQIWKDKVRDAARIERLKTDPHSPGQFRANGALRNQTPFDEAFGVKPGDGMYLPPDQRISIW